MGLIAIGDIHGCAGSLDALLRELAPSEDDHLVFIGDYIDRGPNSRGVIDRLLGLKEHTECTFLRGNHEALMLDYLERGEYEVWHTNGGVATLSSYVTEQRQVEIPEEHVEFIKATRMFLDTPEFFFVHAGLRPYLSVEEQVKRGNEGIYLWERSHLNARDLAWEKPVVCGHTPQAEPLNRDKLICIDTGCVYAMHPQYGRLTAVRLPDREFVQVRYQE